MGFGILGLSSFLELGCMFISGRGNIHLVCECLIKNMVGHIGSKLISLQVKSILSGGTLLRID